MRYAADASVPDNSFATALTCPSNHKFEVIESLVVVQPAAGALTAHFAVLPVGTIITGGFAAMPAGPFTDRVSSNGFVLEAGDQWQLAVVGNGAAWQWLVTYVDVTF